MLRAAAILVAAAFALVGAHPAAAEEELCARLHAFYEAPFEESAHFRTVRFYWNGHWLDFSEGWGVNCQPSPDAAAKKLCDWLPTNTSYEFAGSLPINILQCVRGISLRQDGVALDLTYATASIYTDDRDVRLLIDFRPRKTSSRGIQLVVSELLPTHGYNEAAEAIPDLFGPDNPVTGP